VVQEGERPDPATADAIQTFWEEELGIETEQ
jgi:hypothetical protein